jgi:hypothetical protein
MIVPYGDPWCILVRIQESYVGTVLVETLTVVVYSGELAPKNSSANWRANQWSVKTFHE